MDDFTNSKTVAESWLRANNSAFYLVSEDQEEKRLVFGNSDAQMSFTITCPGCQGDSWSVWSDEEKVLHQLQDVMGYLDCRENLTIDTVLSHVMRSLSKVASTPSSSSKPPDDGESDSDCFDDAMDDEEEEEDVECDDFDYYEGDDPDAKEEESQVAKTEEEKEEDKTMMTFFQASGEKARPSTIQRLCKDMRSLAKTGEKYGFSAGPDGNNLFKWKVRLLDIPAESKLGKDLQYYAQKTKQEAVIHMEMQFPYDYPFNPPFLRVVKPRFKFLTGHVTIGGSICMEMLTKSGWLPTNDIEGILVQVRTEILSDPNASLDNTKWLVPYTEEEARDAFNRMVARYGWDK